MVYTRRLFMVVFFVGLLTRLGSEPGPLGIWQLQNWQIWGAGLTGWLISSWIINRRGTK